MSAIASRSWLNFRLRKGRSTVPSPRTGSYDSYDAHAARVCSDLSDALPDEDLTEDPAEALELYVPGSKPRCEEAEYLELVEDAVDRIARGDADER
ncbi:hypothetical protein [Streptomyces sp. ODS28]|uniref:hypothetical protein n=1 Tax=Streptomyces sp. ODS28 TaxID=3136688 RepID=UPI0031F03135